MLTHRYPAPPNRGDRIRAFHLLGELSEHFDVSLACVSDREPTAEEIALLRDRVDRCALRVIGEPSSRLRGLAALAKGRPATPACFYRRDLADRVVQWHRAQPFDAVLTFCSGMIRYAEAVLWATPASHARPRHVLDLVDVDSSKWSAYARQRRWRWLDPMRWVYAAEARRLRPVEAGESVPFDRVTVVSEREASEYRRHFGENDRLAVVSNGVDLEAYLPRRGPEADPAVARVVFVGQMDYPPNVEAVRWFARSVWPMVRTATPSAVFRIVGRAPAAEVSALTAQPGVEVTGEVPSVIDELNAATVVVAPLRIARGVQNKVLEAMAAARPVVCSPQAYEGVGGLRGSELLVADTPEQWVRDVVSLLRDPARRSHIGHAARSRMEKDRPWPVALSPMRDLLDPPTLHPLPRVA